MQFSPSSLSSTANQRIQIQKVFVAGHSASPAELGSSAMVNHWCFYLQMSGSSSIRMDMTPSPVLSPGARDEDGTLGCLLIQELRYLLSNQVVKHFEIAKRGSLTLGDVLSAIREEGYQNYDFNQKGLGCRYWTTKVLQMLQEKGLIGDFSEVLQALPKAWDKNGQLPLGKSVESGTFH